MPGTKLVPAVIAMAIIMAAAIAFDAGPTAPAGIATMIPTAELVMTKVVESIQC